VGKFSAEVGEELTLYARTSAWWSAGRRRKTKAGEESVPSRLADEKEKRGDGWQPEMPEVRAPHVIGYLFEMGPLASGGMGPAPLSHQEIAAWCDLTGIRLSPWEVRTVRQLSRDYLAELHEAEDPKRPAPWRPEAPDVGVVAQDMRAALRGLTNL
jgi:hypothetical protein